MGTPVYKPSGFPTASVTFGFQLTAQFLATKAAQERRVITDCETERHKPDIGRAAKVGATSRPADLSPFSNSPPASWFYPRPKGAARQFFPKCVTSHSSDEKTVTVPGMMRTLR